MPDQVSGTKDQPNAPGLINLNASASEEQDIKPLIKPFPLDAPDKPLEKLTSSEKLLPPSIVKREPSPISTSSLLRQKTTSHTPIYISSDSESEDAGEVDAQMHVAQPVTSDSARKPRDEDDEDEDDDEPSDQDRENSQSEDEDMEQDDKDELEGQKELDEQGEEDKLDRQNDQTEQNEQDEDQQDELDEADDNQPSKDTHDEHCKIEKEKGSEGAANHEDIGDAQKSPLPTSSVASPSPPSSSASSNSSSNSSSLSSSTPLKISLVSKVQPKLKTPSSSQPPPAATKKRPLPSALPQSLTQPIAPTRRTFIRAQSNGSTVVATPTVVCDPEEDEKRYTKRQKTDSVGPSRNNLKAHKSRNRHPDYWFLDGSVIIQIGDVMFRLHRSRLANSSTYFHDLFLGPKPADIVENCPVYHVKGVSISDFEELLVSLDNAISYVYSPPTFLQLAAILRAAQTFRFSTLEDFASRTLRQTWPRELSKLTDTRIPHASETIILSRKCDMPELSKRAFYELVRTTRLGEDEDADTEDPDVMNAMISRQDLARLIKAREELVSRWIFTAGGPPDLTCGTIADHPPLDKAKLLSDWQEHVKSSLFEECIYDPLVGLQRLIDIKWEGLGYCGACVGAWRDVWQAQRVKLWQQLDLWLDLPADEQL